MGAYKDIILSHDMNIKFKMSKSLEANFYNSIFNAMNVLLEYLNITVYRYYHFIIVAIQWSLGIMTALAGSSTFHNVNPPLVIKFYMIIYQKIYTVFTRLNTPPYIVATLHQCHKIMSIDVASEY